MATVIAYEGVSKTFRLNAAGLIKNAVLTDFRRRSSAKQFTALDNVSFTVDEGDSLALLGHNGSGKSTALKLLTGVYAPSAGVVRGRGRIAALLELGSGFHPDLSGIENVFLNSAILGIPRGEVLSRLNEIIEFADVGRFLEEPVKHYSSGMLVRLGFSIAVCLNPDILVLDEIMGVGDKEFQERSRGRIRALKDSGVTVVLVTHDWAMASEFCNKAVVLDQGRLTYYGAMQGSLQAFMASRRSSG